MEIKVKMKKRTNLEILLIIVSAWNYSMAESNAICAKSNNDISDGLLELMSFISGKEVSINDVILSKDQYTNDAIDYYNNFKKYSQNIKFTRWKSLKNNYLIKSYGIIFDTYLSNGFNTDFLKYVPFFKLTERQMAKMFIKLKNIIEK